MTKHLLCFSNVPGTLLTSACRLEQLLYTSPFASGYRRQTDRLEVGDRLVNHVGTMWATDLAAADVFQLLGQPWIASVHTVLEKAPQEEI